MHNNQSKKDSNSHLYFLDDMLVSLTDEQVKRGKSLGLHIELAMLEETTV